MKDKVFTGLKIAVSVALLVVVALTVDLGNVWETLITAAWLPLLVAFLLYQLGILVRAYRWQALLVGQGLPVPLARLIYLYYVGTFFNNFLPTGFGGDVVKMVELTRDGSSGALAVSTVLADRLIGLVGLFLMALVALPFSGRLVPPGIVLILLALIAGLAVGITLLLNRRLIPTLAARLPFSRRALEHPKVVALYTSFHCYTGEALVKSGLASLAFNLLLILVNIQIAQSVAVALPWGYFFLFVPILSSLLALPISISGLGVREGAYVVLFGQAGVASNRALAMSLLYYALGFVTGLIGGALYIVQSVRELVRRHARSSTPARSPRDSGPRESPDPD